MLRHFVSPEKAGVRNALKSPDSGLRRNEGKRGLSGHAGKGKYQQLFNIKGYLLMTV